MNWGVVNGTNVLFIGTLEGEIWSWNSNEISAINDNSSSMNLEYRTENNGSIEFIDVNGNDTNIIAGIYSIGTGNEIQILNSSLITIHSRYENGLIGKGKWNYDYQIQYYYSIEGFSRVYSITQNGELLNHQNYYVFDSPVNNLGSFRFSFSDSFNLFGVLFDNKIRIYNTTLGKPNSENLFFEYYEVGFPIDNFAIHLSSPLIVFNRGLPIPNSNKYESEIVVADIFSNSIEYVLIPSIFITEYEYLPIKLLYGVSYGMLAIIIIWNELAIKTKLRKKEMYVKKKKIISERIQSLYPKK